MTEVIAAGGMALFFGIPAAATVEIGLLVIGLVGTEGTPGIGAGDDVGAGAGFVGGGGNVLAVGAVDAGGNTPADGDIVAGGKFGGGGGGVFKTGKSVGVPGF